MLTTDIYVYSKNTDLHAMSAFEAITGVLGVNELTCLRRFRHFKLTFDTNTSSDVESYLDHLLNDSFYLVNPNKEGVYINGLPQPEPRDGIHVLYCNIQSRSGAKHDEQLQSQILSSVNVPISSLHFSLVWELTLSSVESLDDVQQLLQNKVVMSTSHSNGVLANPITDEASFIRIPSLETNVPAT